MNFAGNMRMLDNFISIIKTGSRAEVKEAQKQVEKFWHEVYFTHREKGKKSFLIFLEEIKKFEEIKDIDHQAYLINTLKWPFWVIGEEHFEEWADFILKYIQHPSGKIRQAILSAVEYLVIDITDDYNKEKKIIENNMNRFFNFVYSAEQLLQKYECPKYNHYKYINNMPSGVYKSLQYLVCEKLLRAEKYRYLYKEFLQRYFDEPDSISSRPGVVNEAQQIISRQKILQRRKEVEQELENFLKGTKSDFTLDHIKDIIYNEKEIGDLMKIIAMFDNGQGLVEMDDILQLVNEAWNIFPHKCLNGLSPEEKLLEYQMGC